LQRNKACLLSALPMLQCRKASFIVQATNFSCNFTTDIKKYMKFQGRYPQITAQSLSNRKSEPFQTLFEAFQRFWSYVIFIPSNSNPKFTWDRIAYN